ncbi:MAG: methyltransferase domain-containing protein [Actinomycetota bacterium]|nr:methyltransferase domain-containing protein [Actinomycetota bacterium]
MADGTNPYPELPEAGPQERYGVPLDSALARRERLADRYDIDFGKDRVFPRLVEAMLEEVPEGARVLEVGAATGLLTRPLLEKAGHVTALEPSEGMLRRLLASDVADSPHLRITKGMVEDLLHDQRFDMGVVTFTPRRGVGLYQLLMELGVRVSTKVVMLLDDDGTMDWAYLARSASVQGFDVRVQLVTSRDEDPARRRRAVLLVADVRRWQPSLAEPMEDWALDARELTVPFPPPRGAATRLVRYVLSGGDRAVRVVTDERGIDRLYGNLRTAVHRLAREDLTVRRTGDEIQVVRLPRGGHEDASVE